MVLKALNCFALCFFCLGAAAVSAPALPIQVVDVTGRPIEVIERDGIAQLSEYRPGSRLILSPSLSECRLNGRSCPRELSLTLPAFPSPEDGQLKLRWRQGKSRRQLTIAVLGEDFPWMQAQGKSLLGLPIIFSASPLHTRQARCNLVVLSAQGEVLFHRRLEVMCMDFRPHQVQGKTYYSYQEVLNSISDVGTFGPRVLLDENFHPIERFDYNFDGHEFLLLGRHHWVAIEIAIGRLKNGRAFLDRRVRERDQGRIVFDWGNANFLTDSGTEATLLSSLHLYQGELLLDLIHLNSLQRLATGDLIVGLGTNGVAYVNRAKQRHEWVLGGAVDEFSLTPQQQPVFQHNAHFDSTTNELHLYSNFAGPTNKSYSSRVLRYRLNPLQRKVLSFTVLREKQELSVVMGSLQVHGEVLSIGVGTKVYGKHDFVEQVTGKEVLTFQFSSPDVVVYRIYRGPFGE